MSVIAFLGSRRWRFGCEYWLSAAHSMLTNPFCNVLCISSLETSLRRESQVHCFQYEMSVTLSAEKCKLYRAYLSKIILLWGEDIVWPLSLLVYRVEVFSTVRLSESLRPVVHWNRIRPSISSPVYGRIRPTDPIICKVGRPLEPYSSE
jgi:hypothetical protein